MAPLTALATEPPKPAAQVGVLGPVLAALLEKDPLLRADAATAERLLRRAAAGEELTQALLTPSTRTVAAGGTMRVRDRCVTVDGLVNGARLALAPCDGRPAEQFTCNESFDLVSLAANRCGDMLDASPAGAAPAQICFCTGAGDQRWHY